MRKTFDILIIGAGLGGLQTGAILCRKGFEVGVLEKNHVIGGTLQTFPRGGCDFSTGMHYMGSLDEGQILHRFFKYLNLFDRIKYKRLDQDAFEIFNIAGKEYKFPQGFDAWGRQIRGYFPGEEKAINNYIKRIKYNLDAQDINSLIDPDFATIKNKEFLSTNAFQEIQSLTTNKELQNVLGALNFVYAGIKEKTPLYVHALINNYFISSSYRVIGKTDQIAESLANTIKQNGGQVFTDKKAKEFIFEDKQMTAIETEDGDRFFAKNFISNLHPALTMDLIAEGKIRKPFRKRMKNLSNTLSAFGLHLNLKKDTVKYRNYNYQYFRQNEVWYASTYKEANWPEHYFMHASLKTPNDQYSNCIGILTYMKFNEVEKWADLPSKKRGQEYQDWKRRKSEQLLALVGERFPEITENVINFTASTPLTYRDYIGTHDGSMYGTLRDYRDPVGSYISPRTKIPNLFFTGQNLNLHGMLGVSLSSLVTCGEFIDLKTLIKEVNNA